MKIPFEALYKMPIRDRKYYVKLFNEENEKKQSNNGSTGGGRTRSVTGEEIEEYI